MSVALKLEDKMQCVHRIKNKCDSLVQGFNITSKHTILFITDYLQWNMTIFCLNIFTSPLSIIRHVSISLS